MEKQIIFIFDTSNTMGGVITSLKKKICDNLIEEPNKDNKEEDKGILITFSSVTKLHIGKNSLKNKISKISACGSTNLNETPKILFENLKKDVIYKLYFITDGMINTPETFDMNMNEYFDKLNKFYLDVTCIQVGTEGALTVYTAFKLLDTLASFKLINYENDTFENLFKEDLEKFKNEKFLIIETKKNNVARFPWDNLSNKTILCSNSLYCVANLQNRSMDEFVNSKNEICYFDTIPTKDNEYLKLMNIFIKSLVLSKKPGVIKNIIRFIVTNYPPSYNKFTLLDEYQNIKLVDKTNNDSIIKFLQDNYKNINLDNNSNKKSNIKLLNTYKFSTDWINNVDKSAYVRIMCSDTQGNFNEPLEVLNKTINKLTTVFIKNKNDATKIYLNLEFYTENKKSLNVKYNIVNHETTEIYLEYGAGYSRTGTKGDLVILNHTSVASNQIQDGDLYILEINMDQSDVYKSITPLKTREDIPIKRVMRPPSSSRNRAYFDDSSEYSRSMHASTSGMGNRSENSSNQMKRSTGMFQSFKAFRCNDGKVINLSTAKIVESTTSTQKYEITKKSFDFKNESIMFNFIILHDKEFENLKLNFDKIDINKITDDNQLNNDGIIVPKRKIDTITNDDDLKKPQCLICFDYKFLEYLALPCRHMLYCQNCYDKITNNPDYISSLYKCPKCREIMKVVKIYT
jgi:hypothetical protein